jgi:hypothetical protein
VSAEEHASKVGANLSYDAETVTIPHLIFVAKLQALSGALYYIVMARLYYGANEFAKKNMVVVIEKGHVLPGIMQKNRENNYELIGLDTAVQGKGKKSYGVVKDLDKKPDAYRVIDAELFMLATIFESELADPAAFREKILQKTNQIYGNQIPLQALEANVKKITDPNPAWGARQSFLAFGQSRVIDPTRERKDEIEAPSASAATAQASNEATTSGSMAAGEEVNSSDDGEEEGDSN